MTPEAFSNAVLAWYDQHGRKDLPWQHDISPYRVWVSEIMLQQTQVSTVLGYFDRFMHALPDVHALAAASEDQVLHLWTGLGYYSRARNLHKTAQQVVTQFGGEFPASVEQLCTLPGIGRSTAGAIASLSMGINAPILDGNVKRVLARFLAQTGWPGDSATSKALWAAAERYTPNQRGHHYTQAMMDLGATLCTRSKPQCLLCPLASHCQARLLGTPTAFPESKPRKVLPQKQVVMPLFAHNGHVLLYKRPSQGLWGGLWSLPELDQTDAIATQAAQLQLNTGEHQALPSLTHTFSHFQLQISPVLIHCQASPSVAEGDWLWYNLSAPPTLGLAAPVQKLLQQAAEHLTRC
ncbi:A/G-specific adenine glycosylase [Atopomonas sediminilitoris]|uniref:A/G-specific adenine glycosylase n=1 Tax=Atopomonas sediminilitoris TaxID=2919919 RepID=UPI001F4DC40E|nr:A/G-specific adenine glycosylase [Atopomonas sediminilitoris]MCJ8168381.1 A/G-specific adenine glycosylase [Atopomonas sediminilitoris]